MTSWIFAHGDSDGICSWAIALAARPKSHVFFSHPFGLLEDLGRVNLGDDIVICDIAYCQEPLCNIIGRLRELAKAGSLTYIDHHPLPETIGPSDLPGKVVHGLGECTSELAFREFRCRPLIG